METKKFSIKKYRLFRKVFSRILMAVFAVICFFAGFISTNKIVEYAVYKNNASDTMVTVYQVILCIATVSCAFAVNFFVYLYLYRFDPMVPIFSYSYFEKKVTRRLNRDRSSRFLMITCDIRGFKFINQTCGFDYGDEFIYKFAKTIKYYTKKKGGICSHSYADNFFAFFRIDSISEALDDFTDAIKLIDDNVKNSDINVFFKYGLCIIEPVSKEYLKERNAKDFIGKARFAKTLIKSKVNKAFEIYSPKIEEKIKGEQLIEQELNTAVENDEFFVVYQPKINLTNEKIVGAEALVRWNSSNPMLGLLSPGKFIPVFEKNGFIEELDFIVYEKTFKFIKEQLEIGNPIVPISINLSRVHISSKKFKEFFERFMNLFNRFNIPSNLVEIEILEQSATEDSEFLTRVIDAFHSNGFSVAMDDFGSGESSLNMLSSIPIDVVKFDQNFLRRQNINDGSENVIATLVNLGKVLKKHTVFEGVETEEQKEFLKSIDCDVVQGFYYSRPLDEDKLVEFIKRHL